MANEPQVPDAGTLEAKGEATPKGEVTPKLEGQPTETDVAKDRKELISKLGDLSPEEVREIDSFKREADRRVTEALKTKEKGVQAQIEAAVLKERRKVEEDKLLADQNTSELYEREKSKREEAEIRLESLEREMKVTALLDKKELTDSAIRQVFLAVHGDLTEIDLMIDGFMEVVNTRVGTEVEKRLVTAPPPKSDKLEKSQEAGTLSERLKIAENEASKSGDWTAYTKLANEMSDRVAKAQGPGVLVNQTG